MNQSATIYSVTWLSLLIVGILLLNASPVEAKRAFSGSDVTITITTGPEFLMDANSGCAAEPNASYVGYEICNISSDTLWDIQARLGNFTDSDFGLAGGQVDSQRIGMLIPGECRNLYWYVFFDCDNSGASTDLTLTLTDSSGTAVTDTENLSVIDVITASAGGVMVSVNDSIGGYVGSVLIVDYTYSFGNMKRNGELHMQPAGNLDFDADCFQLIGSEVIASDVNDVDVGDRDELYYVLGSATSGSSHEIKVRYFFMNQCEGVSTEARGFAAATSGNALKLSPNIGDPSIDFELPDAANPFVMSKSVAESSISAGNSANYTVTLSNSSSQYIVVDQVIDVLPTDFTFDTTAIGSDIHVEKAAKSPSRGDSDTLRWWGGTAASVYPYREFLLAPSASLDLTYSASSSPLSVTGEYINYAQAVAGSFETPVVFAALCVGGSPCTLGSTEWITLEGAYQGDRVALNWTLRQTEIPAAMYVEQSQEGNTFSRRGSISPTHSAGTYSYDFLDIPQGLNEQGTQYYRIELVNAAGTSSFSPIIEIDEQAQIQPRLSIYPTDQPTTYRIGFEGATSQPIRLRITNSMGQVFVNQQVVSDKFEFSHFPAGVYLITASDGRQIVSQKLIISSQ